MQRRQMIATTGAAAMGLGVTPIVGTAAALAAESSDKHPGLELELESQAIVNATANPPYLFDLGPQKSRQFVDKLQSGPVLKLVVDSEDKMIPGGPGGKVSIRIIRPAGTQGSLPVILYIHGGGWVVGNAHTHDRLVRELAIGAKAAIVFVNYSLSPEARYPVAIEEIYAAAKWISEEGFKHGLESRTLTVAGDSAGGNMTAAITLLAKQRQGPEIRQQLLFYPVTDSTFDSPSYRQFATGYYLRRDVMMWYWDQYTTDARQREEITASPLRATCDQLRGLPRALIVTAEADVLRDEGEAYANHLRQAGVSVTATRFQGVVHNFVTLNSMSTSAAARGAMALATTWLRHGFVPQR